MSTSKALVEGTGAGLLVTGEYFLIPSNVNLLFVYNYTYIIEYEPLPGTTSMVISFKDGNGLE